jgi:hypothetical protein
MRVTKGVSRLAFLLVAAGCGQSKPEKIDAVTAPQEMAARARVIVGGAGQASAFAGDEGSVLSHALSAADDASQGLVSGAMRAPMPVPMMGNMGASPAIGDMMGSPRISFLTREEKYDETGKDLEVLIRDRLLVASNIESQTDTEIVYLLKGDPTCRKLPSQVASGPAPLDDKCAGDLPRLQVRIVLRADGDGARFTVLLGPDRLELSAFVVHSDLLAWEMDLASAKKASDFADMTLGKPGQPEPSPVGRLEGRVKLALQKLGDKKVTASFGVLAPLAIESMNPPQSFTTAKSDPLFAVTGDGVAKQLTFKLALGSTEVRGSWDPRSTGSPNQDLQVAIGGLYGETTISEGSKEMLWKGVGIGHTAVAVRGASIFEVDLNPADGRKLDLKLTAPDKVARIEVTPKFDLTLGAKLGAVAGDFKDPPPAHLRDESYGIVLAPGTAPPAVIELRGPSGDFKGGIKVVSGSLALSARGAPAARVSVPAGQCLTGLEMPPPGAHPILGGLTAVSCP